MTLPMVLKQLRTELQLQQKELAELLNVNALTINRWETGKTRPSKAIGISLLHIAKEKGVSEVCLAGLEDVLHPKHEIVEKTNDLRYTEIDSINQLVNEAPNGVIVIGFENYEILYMNDKMIELTGVSMEEASSMKCYQLLVQTERVCNICHKDEKSYGEFSEKVYSSARYGSCHGRYYVINTKLITWKGQKALIKYFTDITELKELQQQVQQQKEALNCAAQFAGMHVFQYDVQKNTAFLMTDIPEPGELPVKVENFDTSAIHNGLILPEYEEAYRQMLQDIKDGKKQAEAEIRTNEPDQRSNWLHFQMNLSALDEDGEPLTAIGSVRVINQEKSMQHAYCNFGVLYLKSGQLNKYSFSATERRSKVAVVDYTTEMREWCERYVLPADRDHFMECTDLQGLPEKLGGKNVYHYSYRYVSDKDVIGRRIGRIIWIDYENKICMISSTAIEEGR